MNKNLLLVQNGFPGSISSGTVIDSLDIKNFFKFEKNTTPTLYSARYTYSQNSNNSSCHLYPFNSERSTNTPTKTDLLHIKKHCIPSQWYEPETGELKYNNNFKHYSISFLLFAVRMKQGFLGTNITISSRLLSDNPLKLRFFNIGNTVDSFTSLNDIPYVNDPSQNWIYTQYPHKFLSDSIIIPSVNQHNHCFLAVLFSDSAYTLESGTVLLNNEPLLNISWTETEFIGVQ